MSVTLWFNPRCGTARTVRQWLDDNGHEYVLREYLKEPPSREEIAGVLANGDMQPTDLFRSKEALAQDLGLRGSDDQDAILDAMAANPVLINRPIVIDGDRARLCRPASEVESFLA
ncbi:arsenate reductase family protein [Pacificimonas sp. ICDLI1SI03]